MGRTVKPTLVGVDGLERILTCRLCGSQEFYESQRLQMAQMMHRSLMRVYMCTNCGQVELNAGNSAAFRNAFDRQLLSRFGLFVVGTAVLWLVFLIS